jgi:hypothetical protein
MNGEQLSYQVWLRLEFLSIVTREIAEKMNERGGEVRLVVERMEMEMKFEGKG